MLSAGVEFILPIYNKYINIKWVKLIQLKDYVWIKNSVLD